MIKKLLLTWGNAHSLMVVDFNCSQARKGFLLLRKGEGNNQMVPPFDLHASIGEIEAAWEKQGKQWQERLLLNDKEHQLFAAVRWIDMGNGRFIVWYVFHEYGKPADVCVELFNATPEQFIDAFPYAHALQPAA